MDHVAGLVDAVVGVGLGKDFALDVDLHQARRGDLLVQQPVEVDQQVLGARDARGDVVVDQVGHLIAVDQPVARREFHAGLPFRIGNLAFERLEVGCVVHETPALLGVCAPAPICEQHNPPARDQAKRMAAWVRRPRARRRHSAEQRKGDAGAGRGRGLDDRAAGPDHRNRADRQDRGLRHALHRPGAFAADDRRHRADLHGRARRRHHACRARAGQHPGIYLAGAGRRRARHHRPACTLRRRSSRRGPRREAAAARRTLQHRTVPAVAIPLVSRRGDLQGDQRRHHGDRAVRIHRRAGARRRNRRRRRRRYRSGRPQRHARRHGARRAVRPSQGARNLRQA